MSAVLPLDGDEVRASVSIALPLADTFRVFTEEVDLWWRRGRRFRSAPTSRGIVCIEPGPGGRVFESFDTEEGERVVEIGRTLAWEPPHRLLLEWRNAAFTADERTEVEVLFRSSGSKTMVTVIHRGWSRIDPAHVVRHGQPVAAFLRSTAMWWGDQLTALRLRGVSPPLRG